MSFTKRGEAIELLAIESSSSSIPVVDAQILANFQKFAKNVKKIAPKADDFLYFSAVMMHAAEAALLNDDGSPKLTSKGAAVTAHWDHTGGSWRWKSNDPNTKPYKNSNGDIFPEEELKKAYRKWVGKPLCIDHKSSSVDHIRGFIVDTVYDDKLKRVIALCALDKKNYPDLARKVSTGYSSSVSMGTAVGKAICADCGQVAKTEADFCKCMRGRTCYGEINVDLSPIELSIVVNGADPKAHIKHIIASANTLNAFVENKSSILSKLAADTFNATLNFNAGKDDTGQNSSVSQINVNSTDLESFKRDVEKAISDYQTLNSSINEENMSEDTNDTASNQTESTVAMPETDTESTDFSLAPPVQRFASSEVQEVRAQLETIQAGIIKMQRDFDKLANNTSRKQEEIMSGSRDNSLDKRGYFQAGGGVNEPTPGQVKYTKDPLQDDLRDNGDKHMTGPAPFPGVGNVEDMYPGVGEKDLEIKRLHARAAVEERAQKRAALVSKAKEALENRKLGYFGGTTEPTPGKKQYPVDPLQDNLRDDSDKQMVGQKPFPDVGKVDGLHPSPASADVADELKRKEMLARANRISGRFIKAVKTDGTHDKAKSAWEFYRGDKLILSASVEELTEGKVETYYAGVANTGFGQDLLNKVKTVGAEAVKSSFKKVAQDAPPALPPAPDAAAPMGDAPTDTGAEGDPKDTALELSEKVKDLSSDLNEAVKALTGEQTEMGEMDGMTAPDAGAASDGKVSTAALHKMRKELNPALLQACKEAVASLDDHAQELDTIVAMHDKGAVNKANSEFVGSLVQDAIVEAKEAFADSFSLLNGFARYARSTKAIVKRAKQEAELNKMAHGDDMTGQANGLMAMVDEVAPAMDAEASEAEAFDAMMASDLAASSMDSNDAVMMPDAAKAAEFAKANPTVPVEVKLADTKAGRAALRAKLAGEMKWNPMLAEFHKHIDDGPDFDVKPSEGFDKVEPIEDIHDRMMDVATTPVKVRKMAEDIQRLIVKGEIKASELPQLVANGLDGDAVKYWKQFYGQAGSEGSQFASELVKEHVKAQLEEQMSVYRTKLARAFELAYDMVERGMVSNAKSSINEQVDSIMKWNDDGFESMKRVIANRAPNNVKTAGRMPQVGLSNPGEEPAASDDMASLLASAFSKSGKRLF